MAKKSVEKKKVSDLLEKAAEKEINAVIASTPKRAGSSQKEEFADMIKTAMKAMVEEMLPALVAMNKAERPALDAAEKKIRRWNICRECLQKGPGEPPCTKNGHIKMVVFPTRFPHFSKYFQGSQINGVRYLSSNRREKILVPADCEGQILKQIEDWEDNEMATMAGARVVEHDSGDIRESGGNSIKQATVGWR